MARSPVQLATEYAAAGWRLAARQAKAEWRGLPFTLGAGPAPRRVVAWPQDLRPPDPALARAILEGRWPLAGAELDVGVGGDPWDRVSPSRAFAVELHRFAWLPSLAAESETGAREALRLTLDWERLFGRAGGFAWTGEVLERRVFNLACGLNSMLAGSAEGETTRVLALLARQARALLSLEDAPARAAERAAATALAAAAFDPASGAVLLKAALARLAPGVKAAVLADGGHRSRSPEAGLELLLDLLALDGVLQARGQAAPPAVSRSMDRLSAGVRFFTQPDGRLAGFHGGAFSDAERIKAALAANDAGGSRPPDYAPHTGYQRLTARTLRVLVDAAAPAEGTWSVSATAHAVALEVTVGTERLIASAAGGVDPIGARRTPAGSTTTVADGSLGEVLVGARARGLGPRLVGGVNEVDVRRNAEADDPLWIELSHQGWVERHGFIHLRRLFVDVQADELRGEDRLTPAGGQPAQTPYAVRFNLAEGVDASMRDERSVRLTTPGGQAWSLRNDADGATIEPGVVVLRGQIRPQGGARVRWKIAPEKAGG
jgi:uncharacterized heparinase superfamily protein